MRVILQILILISFTINSFSQIPIDLYFFDACDEKIKKLDFTIFDDNFNIVNFDLDSMKYKPYEVDSIGSYMISTGFSIKDDNYKESINEIIDIKENKKYTDTIFVSKIRFVTSRTLHSTYWNYFNCSTLCDGFETDYYANGNKKTEGKYEKGKPIEITEFRKNGIKELTKFFENNNLAPYKTIYFDENGVFEEYELEKVENGQVVFEIYDIDDNLIEKTDSEGNVID